MPVFRRNSAGAAEGQAQGSQSPQATQTEEAPAKTRQAPQPGKGRPTPKRAAAEASRYRTVTGATTSGRGAAPAPGRKLTPQEKDQARQDRGKQMRAMRRGEEWALGPRDRGPAKKLVRDYVDAHRRPMEFYMYALILLVIALFAGRSNSSVSNYMQLFLLAIVAVIIVDALLLRRSIQKAVADRLPDESTRGLTLYAVMRALQLRRFRTPAPAVKPGDEY
jgi:hypothetical protein